MTALNEFEFEILPSENADDGFVFGAFRPIAVDEEGFVPGDAGWLTQDQQDSTSGRTRFGRDVPSAPVWAWESFVNVTNENEAAEELDGFRAAWAPDTLVENVGAVTALRFRIGGRTRRIYGRPRRFSALPTNRILGGFVAISHDFQCVDDLVYSDQMSSQEILYSTVSSGGGFVLPAALPISTSPSEGFGVGQLAVAGNRRTYPIIRLNGPWTDPVFDTGDWVLKWTGTIPDGDYVEVDTRPFHRTVKWKSGASAITGFRRQRLEDMWFAPGARPQVALDGSAPGGGASATVMWRDTWASF